MFSSKPKTITNYIKASPKETQAKLREMRAIIKKAAPGATEDIKWSMPAFVDSRILVMFGAFTHHIGLFPTGSVTSKFKKELAKYHTGKGSIQFPLDKPLPKSLITKIVKYRVKENKEKDAKWRN